MSAAPKERGAPDCTHAGVQSPGRSLKRCPPSSGAARLLLRFTSLQVCGTERKRGPGLQASRRSVSCRSLSAVDSLFRSSPALSTLHFTGSLRYRKKEGHHSSRHTGVQSPAGVVRGAPLSFSAVDIQCTGLASRSSIAAVARCTPHSRFVIICSPI